MRTFGLPCLYLLAGGGVKENVESAELVALQSGMEQAIGGIAGSGGRGLECARVGGREHSAESGKQPHGIGVSQGARGVVPARHKFRGILGRSEAWFQLGGSGVIEAEVGGVEALFEDCHPGE